MLKELRKRAKEAVAKRVEKRVERYKNKLKQQLPSQISLWSAREDRLLKIISKKAGVSIAALLIRQCPNPPCEVDPDTDDETKTEDENIKVSDITDNNDDPTIRAWTASDKGYSRLPVCLRACVPVPFYTSRSPASLTAITHLCVVAGAALEISEKQRDRLQNQTMAMAQYCGMMCNRAKTMLNFVEKECPSNRGNVLTLFRKKYPMFGLRTITNNIIGKFGTTHTYLHIHRTHTRSRTHTYIH